jgi:hypothetical protein
MGSNAKCQGKNLQLDRRLPINLRDNLWYGYIRWIQNKS